MLYRAGDDLEYTDQTFLKQAYCHIQRWHSRSGNSWVCGWVTGCVHSGACGCVSGCGL